jgi:hypothetical protein
LSSIGDGEGFVPAGYFEDERFLQHGKKEENGVCVSGVRV